MFSKALVFAAALSLTGALAAAADAGGGAIKFHTDRAGFVSINLYGSDGTVVKSLLSNERTAAGDHVANWDGKGADGKPIAGEITWRGIFHEGIGTKLRGWICRGGASSENLSDEKDGWGGDGGYPVAVAADDKQVYLGWSLALQGRAILACDLSGHVIWGYRRPEGPSGCRVVAVDDGIVYVLGGRDGIDASGGAIYRLRAKDGTPVPWPNGATDLRLASLWPSNSDAKPEKADAMAVRNGHIYLSFTRAEFITILDAKTGDYLQTVVGAPPGPLDVTPTQTALPEAPGKPVDADFAVISIRDQMLGKILFAHDPPYVLSSELVPVGRDVTMAAISVVGEKAKFHRATAFIAFGAPYHQIQSNPLVPTGEGVITVGKSGGRPLFGPWIPIALRTIRSMAQAADGQLWVAEGDAFPKRVSVWNTNGHEATLSREFFGTPNDPASGSVINPFEPDKMIGQGCEWRIEKTVGLASCLGVFSRDPMAITRFGVGENGHAYLVVGQQGVGAAGPVSIYEKLGDGDYRLRARLYLAGDDGKELPESEFDHATQVVYWADENDDAQPQPRELHRLPKAMLCAVQATTQDLALHGWMGDGSGWRAKVQSWTPCNAPLYDFAAATALPAAGQVSGDEHWELSARPASGQGSTIECHDLTSKQVRWSRSDSILRQIGGSVRLPEPLKNIWFTADFEGNAWQIETEDGFVLSPMEKVEALDKRPKGKSSAPAPAAPKAPNTFRFGSLTQAIDGKLYLQGTGTGFGNFELTGLETVSALPGGKLTPPVAAPESAPR